MEPIATIRRFNRTVTQRLGALDDGFLGRGRPLGAARLLWEIGPGGRDVRELRERLGLDSGYLSRLLRSLEGEGLVVVGPAAADRRRRTATLTPAGRAERDELERRSDDLARSLLGGLAPAQRERLVAAMDRVERLLSAAQVELVPTDPEHPDARRCVAAYFDEIAARANSSVDPRASRSAEPRELRPPAGLFLVAYLRGEAIGCGGVKHRRGAPSEIKRLWLDPSARGLGLSRGLMAALEAEAARSGADTVRLDTHGSLGEAVALYRSSGYAEVEPFNDEPFADHWFAKRLR